MKPVNLTSYSDFTDLFKTCRSISKGKPLPGGWRMYQRNNLYTVHWAATYGSNSGSQSDATKIFEVDKHNRITFTISQQQLLHHSHSLVTVLYKIVPFVLQRKRKDFYQIGKRRVEKSGWREWITTEGDTPEYFTGIQFDLTTQTCLNPRPDLLDTVIPKVRKQWLRDVKRFKKGLKARAKVGALQGYIDEVVAARATQPSGGWRHNFDNNLPTWSDPRTTQQVIDCMRTEQYPPDLLKLLVQTTYLGWGSGEITNSMILENVDRVFNTHSIHYRKAYGVFDAQTT
jgi:hypothetical protein